MVDAEIFRRIALSLPEVTEAPHFEKASFRVNKKIFATLNVKNNMATVKLSAIDQDVFSAFDNTVIYPVPNKWGKQGWTNINLLNVREDMLTDLLKTAYIETAPKKLGALLNPEE
ncbi:MmcQ/YjbR family DNA-binding protein [Mucilaginibacter sp.]|jgi:hypothetical protein|uniref:MmcQ/YjbR family DNA-binding protein n=1 Tax=Mucilaginibacter sp. TaxID=1882438 RepID=UPI0035692568